MMKIIIISLILIIVILSGCMQFITDDEIFQVVEEETNYYIAGDYLGGLTFNIPKEIETRNGIYINCLLSSPNRTYNYAQRFLPPVGQCFINMYAVTLYYPGLWNIDYSIYEGLDNTGSLKLEGKSRLYVYSNETTYTRFELSEFEVVEIDDGKSISIEFSVKNTGRKGGDVSIILFNNKVFYDPSLMIYRHGYEYYNEEVYLYDGESHDKTIIISDINDDLHLIIQWNGNSKVEIVEYRG